MCQNILMIFPLFKRQNMEFVLETMRQVEQGFSNASNLATTFFDDVTNQGIEDEQEEGEIEVKKVLVLGAGHVCGPLIEYLCRDPKIHLTAASSQEQKLDKLKKYANTHNNMRALVMDVTQEHDALSTLIDESDLVVSLLPYGLHPLVAKMCVNLKTSMVTASYLTDEMKKLHQDAKEAGITIVNEVGLDPGIDHLLAKHVIDQVATSGGRITSFESYCCGLPTPEFADNPLGYKFGWNPTGAFAITMNEARWKENNEIHEAKKGYLMDHAKNVDNFLKGFSLEAFPNRDSLKYQELYGLSDCKTLIRGSLRYRGFSETIKGLRMLGLLDQTPHAYLDPETGANLTWRQLLSETLGCTQNLSKSELMGLVLDKLEKSETCLRSVLDLGLLEDEPVVKCHTPFDTTRYLLIKKYPFEVDERDLVIMRIDFIVEWPHKPTEVKSLTLVVYGDSRGGFSAMAKTVGCTAAIASKMILDGEIQDKGMVLPLNPEIYNPIIERLEKESVLAQESGRKLI